MYSKAQLELCIKWAKKHDIHIISDEIYAMSVFPGTEMLSIAQLKSDYEKIHIVGGLSKDFGMSGFRVGICYTKNKDVIKALSMSGYF